MGTGLTTRMGARRFARVAIEFASALIGVWNLWFLRTQVRPVWQVSWDLVREPAIQDIEESTCCDETTTAFRP